MLVFNGSILGFLELFSLVADVCSAFWLYSGYHVCYDHSGVKDVDCEDRGRRRVPVKSRFCGVDVTKSVSWHFRAATITTKEEGREWHGWAAYATCDMRGPPVDDIACLPIS